MQHHRRRRGLVPRYRVGDEAQPRMPSPEREGEGAERLALLEGPDGADLRSEVNNFEK